MLLSIICLSTPSQFGYWHFKLSDSEFYCESLISRGGVSNIVARTFVVISEYKKRNLPIVPNIVRLNQEWYGGSNHLILQWMEEDKVATDTMFPELEYGSKYYPCVIRQYKKLCVEKEK